MQQIEHLVESAVFICYANNSLGSVNYTFNLSVEKAPEFLSTQPPEQKLDIQQSFTLDCSIDGEPRPTIRWLKDDGLLTYTESSNETELTIEANHMFLSIDQMYLRVEDAAEEHFGNFECMGENYRGSVNRIFAMSFNPYWTEWSPWGECSETCDYGLRKRYRSCRKMHADDVCQGDAVETKPCFIQPCIGQWKNWSDWSSCSRTCGSGQVYRYRECDGFRCIGANIEIAECYRTSCTKINDKYTAFATFTQKPDRMRDRRRKTLNSLQTNPLGTVRRRGNQLQSTKPPHPLSNLNVHLGPSGV